MIAELGHVCLAIAFAMSLLLGVLPLAGAARGSSRLMALAPSLARGHAAFVVLAYISLSYLFAQNDFSLMVVASNSNTQLPLAYRLAAVWGGHEGSMLLWMLMLSLWALAVATFSRRLPADIVARVLGILGLVAVGLHAFLLFTSNPFQRLIPAAPEGRDLNPLLQDPGMVIHPPMLYMGYVGFSVAFAFALSALLAGRLDAAWARWSRPWTTTAWLFLTMGITLGSWWAYNELGWGGWWFWDPVENASFMPWLAGTALIHSLAVTEKRGTFRSWTVLLAIFAFSLSLLGTFLVRSGVLTSVHAFATDPTRGVFILAYLVVVVGGSLAVFAWRAPKVGMGGSFEGVSRESLLLANNVLLTVACAAVMLGTLYPLFLDALKLGKISVGPPYFESVFAPLMAPAVFLMVVGPLAHWKSASAAELFRRLRWALAVGVASAIGTAVVSGHYSAWTAMGVLLAAWVFAASAITLREQVRHSRAPLLSALASQPRGWWGMWLAHLGVAVFVLGVTMVKSFEVESDVRMQAGDTATLGAYSFRFDSISEVPGPNYRALRAVVTVSKQGRTLGVLEPEKRVYTAQQMPMTEAGVDHGFIRDLYVSLGEPVSDGAWAVRLQVKPLVGWIWAGGFLMALGAGFAASDRRYRLRERQRAAGTVPKGMVAGGAA